MKKIKNILIKFYFILKLTQKIGYGQVVKYILAKKSEKIYLTIKDKIILIRKGTPDLNVALDCLEGEFDLLKYLFSKNYDGVIIDAGGYIGTAAIALKDLFPNSKIIIIEPSLKNIEILKVNVQHLTNVKIVYGALVGRKMDKVKLKDRGTGEWGYTAIDHPLDKIDAPTLQEAPAFTISQLGVSLANVGILKLDIEGGEMDLFKNDIESLTKIQFIYAELHDRIVAGCTEFFMDFSKDRVLIKDKHEKFLSIKR